MPIWAEACAVAFGVGIADAAIASPLPKKNSPAKAGLRRFVKEMLIIDHTGQNQHATSMCRGGGALN
jgi:hypothetical protein